MQRTPKLVSALLAVWKTGAAYLPLDPTFPRVRIGAMLDDAGVTLVVTDDATQQQHGDLASTTISVDDDDNYLAEVPPSVNGRARR